MTITITIPKVIRQHMDELEIPLENQPEMFESYVYDHLGITYGEELRNFQQWASEADHIDDFKELEV